MCVECAYLITEAEGQAKILMKLTIVKLECTFSCEIDYLQHRKLVLLIITH